MLKPTLEQLKLLYPNVDADYISDYIERQLLLINIENSKINEVDVILGSYLQRVVGVIADSTNADYYDIKSKTQKDIILNSINEIFDELVVTLCEVEVDGILQTYETSANLYSWILEKYFVDEIGTEYGGEQDVNPNKVVKKNLTKKKATELVSKKVFKKTVGQNINDLVNNFKAELSQLVDSWTSSTKKVSKSKAINQTKEAFKKVTKGVKDVTSAVSQQTVYDAENDVNLIVSDDYKIVYYRVEVLDSNVCLLCMQIDGQIFESPLRQVHKNCRGIDTILLMDENGKYYDTTKKGYGHKLKTKSFETKFDKLSKANKRRMLGKSNYEHYVNGDLSVQDFISYERQITKAEADTKVAFKKIRQQINTPQKATRVANQLELGFPSIDKMNDKQLYEYEKILGYQKQLYNLVPAKNFGSKSRQEYIDDIDAKYNLVKQKREI